MKNKIYTASEYMSQGFTSDEVPYITRHDIIYNKSIDGLASDDEVEEMYKIQAMLGL